MKLYKISNIILILIFLNVINISAQQYSVKPGSQSWNQLKYNEKISVLNVSENVLQKIPTEELIVAYLNYPDIGVIFAYDNIQKGFERICRDFSGLPELLKRKDAFQKIILYYQKMDPGNYDKNQKSGLGYFTFNFMYIELLLSQEIILNQLTNSDLNILIKELLKKYQLKADNIELHSVWGLKFTALPLGRIMRLKSNGNDNFKIILQTPGMEFFIDTVQLQSVDILNSIIKEFSKQ